MGVQKAAEQPALTSAEQDQHKLKKNKGGQPRGCSPHGRFLTVPQDSTCTAWASAQCIIYKLGKRTNPQDRQTLRSTNCAGGIAVTAERSSEQLGTEGICWAPQRLSEEPPDAPGPGRPNFDESRLENADLVWNADLGVAVCSRRTPDA